MIYALTAFSFIAGLFLGLNFLLIAKIEHKEELNRISDELEELTYAVNRK